MRSPHRRGIGARLLTACLLVAAVGWQGPVAQDREVYRLTEEDWPCHGRYRAEFEAGTIWAGPVLDPAEAKRREVPAIVKLAEEAAAPQTSVDQATDMIDTFADGLPQGEQKDRSLAMLFYAVLDELNLYRRFILEGIVQFVARHRLAVDVLASVEAEYQALAYDHSEQANAKRKSLDHRRFWVGRAVEEAEDEARFLCQRLNSLEGRLGSLARAIAVHLKG